jgi:hypothetical protein
MLRTLRLALLAGALFALSATAAGASRPVLPETLTTAHFQIHYDGAPPNGIVHQQAGDLAANLEQAYEVFTGFWGFPAPRSDGDGRVDVYIQPMAGTGALGLAFADAATTQSSGHMWISSDATEMPDTAAHELFHLIQFGMWAPTEPWLLEATAEWAAFRFLDFPSLLLDAGGDEYPLSATLGLPDLSLSCSGQACGLDDYERGGYSRWHFFEWATERYGSSFVKDLFDGAAALNDTGLQGVDLLRAALAAKGVTLSDAFTEWSVANLTGAYTARGLKGVRAKAYGTPLLTGRQTAVLPTQRVSVNHLAARYLSFQRGDGSAAGQCHAATLTLDVKLPFNLGARPYFAWSGPDSTAVPLAISGGSATISVPWDTCTWPGQEGLLSLANPEWNVDSALFTVNASISVDTKTIVTPTGPPPGKYDGPTTPAPTSDEPPSIALYGPEVLRVSAKKRVLRLVVFSSGVGKLSAKLATIGLGTKRLRTGNNDLRYTIPKNMVRTLAARGRSLTLTSLSPAGHVGATVKRRVTLTK